MCYLLGLVTLVVYYKKKVRKEPTLKTHISKTTFIENGNDLQKGIGDVTFTRFQENLCFEIRQQNISFLQSNVWIAKFEVPFLS